MKRFPTVVKLLLLISCISLNFKSYSHNGNNHSHIYELSTNYNLYQICKDDLEGFSEKLWGGAYSYPSLREDVDQAMISRATTGKMAFEFLTSTVPSNYSEKSVRFFFLSDIDLNLRQPYDIIVNDVSLLTFIANEDGTLHLLDNPGSGNAEYFLIRRDHNGDGVGAFRLTVPISKLRKGQKAKIRVQGHAKGSNSWFMLFEADDVIDRLKASVEGEYAFSIKATGDNLVVDAPTHFAGRTIRLYCDDKKSALSTFKKDGELARAVISTESPKTFFALSLDNDLFEIEYPNGDGAAVTSDIRGDYFYHFKSGNHDNWSASLSKLYRPEFFHAYSDFFDRKYEKGKVAILNSSHQDIAWVDRPEVCKILRDTLLLTPILQDAFVRSDYGFDIEDGLMLREYLQRHPDSKDKFTELLNRKLVSVGATYNCPYEDMYDSEDQVRQLYLGKRWVKKNFGGYDSKVYWNVDVPGKTLQYPQILKKAGVDYMVISRHARGLFYWESPDGSSVFTYSPGHYGTDIIQLSKDIGNKIKYGAEQVIEWDQFFQSSINHTPLLSDQDMLPALDYSGFIDTWNNFESVKGEDGTENKVYFPNMELMTADEFMPLAQQYATSVDTIRGERPNVWIYIHGPSHHEAVSYSREASKLLPAAEKFLAIASIMDPGKMPYPANEIDKAWQAKIYPDHGWGGHDGDITDHLFKEKFIEAKDRSSNLLEYGTRFIAGRIISEESKGIPVVLFNSLSWQRTDPVQFSIQFEKGTTTHLTMLDASGNAIATQLTSVKRYADGTIKNAIVHFIATVPSIGYRTYYVVFKSIPRAREMHTEEITDYENDHYRISFVNGGLGQIYDKALQKNLLESDSFAGGEVFTLQSVGNGAGEFGDVQQPTMVDFDRVGLHDASWSVVENGPVFVTYRLEQQIKEAIVVQDVTIYHQLKRVFFTTQLQNWSGKMYREFRTAFPINMENAEISYEVPFGSVRVGKDEIHTAGERYVPLCKDVHPRSVIDWFAASDKEARVVISSDVAAFDWIDPTKENDMPLLQHVLLASRKSCHWEGNEYTQTGNHSYQYMLTSNPADDLSGERWAKQHNDPIKVIVNPEKSIEADLPESMSFFSVDQANVIITAVKKAEDGDGLVVRMYDTKGESKTVKLNSWIRPTKLYQSNIIEENPVPVTTMEVPKYGIETFVLDMPK